MISNTIQSNCEIKNESYLEKIDELKEITDLLIEKITPFIDSYRSKHVLSKPVIAISGCSGVGKTHFSVMLADLFNQRGIHTKILRFDDFLDPEPFEGAIKEVHPSFDYLKAQAFLEKLTKGDELIEKPLWDVSGQEAFKVKEIFDVRGIELLIFEGEFTLCDSRTYDFLKFSNLRVIIDADINNIIKWDWERARYLETNSFSEFTEMRTKSLTRYYGLLDTLRPYADVEIRKEDKHKYFIVRK